MSMDAEAPPEAPDACTRCGHSYDDHDVPESYDGWTPNPLQCPVPGCDCWDVRPSPDDVLAARDAFQKRAERNG